MSQKDVDDLVREYNINLKKIYYFRDVNRELDDNFQHYYILPVSIVLTIIVHKGLNCNTQ